MVQRFVSVGDDFKLPPVVKVEDGNLPAHAKAAAVAAKANAADVVPKWKATTAYTAGQQVISPAGDVVSAKSAHTSGASYVAASWDLSLSYATSAQVGAAYSLATSGKPAPTAAISKMVTAMQVGHGWTNISGTANLNDTTDFCLGTQSAKITTLGTGVGTSFDKTGLALDMTGKSFVLWLKVDDLSKLNYMSVYVGDANLANYWNGQIINVAAYRESQSAVRSGEWTKYIIPFSDLATKFGTPDRANIARIRVTFVDTNTGTGATVRMNGFGLVDETPLYPNGVISLTFDDNSISQYTKGRPKLDQYGYAGTLYPIISSVGAGAGNMTLAQMRALQDLNGWDFGAHASSIAVHGTGVHNFTEAQLVAEFESIRAWMRDNGFRGESYAWPLTDSSTLAEKVASRYFRSARGGFSRTHETLPPSNPFRLRSTGAHGISLAQMKAEVDLAKSGKAWVVFTIHDIVETKVNTVDVLRTDFEALIDYINQQGVAVRTVSQVLAAVV